MAFRSSILIHFCFLLNVLALNNTVYVISNAETPSFGLPGLTPIGVQRAQTCIPALFAGLNVGKIISCPSDADSGTCFSTLATAKPLASSLNLAIDISCGADEETDDDCVTKLMRKFAKTSTQSIVVVWDINALDDFFENINADQPDDDDDDDDSPHFDVLTVVTKNVITKTVSMNCTGIDGQVAGTF